MADGIDRDDSTTERIAPVVEPTPTDQVEDGAGSDAETPDDTTGAEPATDAAGQPADEAEPAAEAEVPTDAAAEEPADDAEPASETDTSNEDADASDDSADGDVADPSGEDEPADEADSPASEDEATDEADSPVGEDAPAEPETEPETEPEDAAADAVAEDDGASDEPVPVAPTTVAPAAAATTVVMPPVAAAATPAPATPAGSRSEVVTPYGSIAAQAPDKSPGGTPVRTSAFGGREAAPTVPATALAGGAAAATAAAATAPAAAATTPAAASTTSAATTATLPPTSTGPGAPTQRAFEHVPQPERASSPLDVFEPQRHERRWPRRLGIAAAVVVVLGGAYVGASYALGDKVPRGATVAGVEVGGLSSAQAVAALDAQLDGATGKAIPVTVHGTTSSLDPAKAGLTFDADATVDRLTGVDLSQPARLWDHLVGVGAQPAVASVDDAKLAAAIKALGASTGKKAVDGSVVFVDGSAHTTAAKDGWALDQDAAKDVVRTSWLSGARPLDLPSTTVAPAITNDETDRAMSAIAEPLTGAPVSVQVDGKLAVLQPLQLAAAATIAPKDGSLQLTMDGAALQADVLKQLPDLLTKPADATFAFKDDKPVLVPGKAGTQLDPTTLATAVAGAAVADDRNVDVALTSTEPQDSTDALAKLGIKEIVSEFSTPLTSEKIRDINIKQGAKNITGTLVKPGETFSLGKALGEVDAAHGFVAAGAIVEGEHTDAMGGGLSQLSTTTYNAAYFAGFQILEHHPHSEWFTRYPEGRESTLFLPTMDMRWKNNSPYGALVQSWVADNRTYVRIWGTKYWTVQSTTSARSGVVQPGTRYSQTKTCEPASAGNPGFTVTVTRRTYLGGQLKDTTSYTTRYKAQDKVVCGKQPKSASSTATSSG